MADAGDKTLLAYNDHSEPKDRTVDAIDKGLDTLVWQGLASVAIPGFTINRIVWAAGKVKWPGKLKSVAPTVSVCPSFQITELVDLFSLQPCGRAPKAGTGIEPARVLTGYWADKHTVHHSSDRRGRPPAHGCLTSTSNAPHNQTLS